MQLKDVLQKSTQFLKDKGFDSPRLDSELMISSVLKWDRVKLYLNYDYPMSEPELSGCRELLKRRAAGEPIAYLLGHKDFYKHSFQVDSNVLVPRPETELLVEETLKWLSANTDGASRIVDFGAGSGCIGLSLAAELEAATVVEVDISNRALEIARKNAETLGLSARVRFVEGDVDVLPVEQIIAVLGGHADAVVANPPYISESDPLVAPGVRKFEPSVALFSPDGGLAHVRSWAKKASQLARDGGYVMFEIGHDQGEAAVRIFEETGRLFDIKIHKDLAGLDRFVSAVKTPGQ